VRTKDFIKEESESSTGCQLDSEYKVAVNVMVDPGPRIFERQKGIS
jgi:hypothetical protein